MLNVGDMLCAIALMLVPIPNNEAVYYAKGNYYSPDAVAIAQAHQAHLMVSVINHNPKSELERMKLYSKIVTSCFN